MKLTAPSNGPPVDAAEARRALGLLVDPEALAQVFSIPGFHHANRMGSDLDGLLAAVEQLHRQGAVYLVHNPLLKKLPIREGVSSGARVRAADAAYRRWLFLDIDPHKADGCENASATEEEHELARQAAEEIREHLAEQGWPAPVLIDSGNGWYLLWRVRLDNTAHSQALIRRFCRVMGERVKDGADVDKKVHDAARLMKLPGTWSKKGDNTPERPWRPCRLVYVPETLEEVSAEMIAAASGPEIAPAPATATTPPPRGSDGASAFALRAGTDRANAYVKKALDNECARVCLSRPPAAGGEGRNDALNKAAFALGTLAGGGYLTRGEIESRLTEAARACGLDRDPHCGERGIAATIRSGIDAGLQKPRVVPDNRPAVAAPATEGPGLAEEAAPESWQLCVDAEVIGSGDDESIAGLPALGEDDGGVKTYQIFTAPQLNATQLPQPVWVVPGLLSEGLNILAGKPKQGKSILALNLAMTISGGGVALGNAPVVPGEVLYLALEDKFRRVQGRMRKMAGQVHQTISSRLHIVTEWPRIHQGGLHLLGRWIASVETPRLIIVDVWPLLKPPPKQGRSAYDEDYSAFGALKKFCDQRGVNCLALLHCRKAVSEDVLEEVSGTLGQVGAADGIIVLNRSRKDNDAKIFVCGRDVDEQELSLSFDLPTLTWKSLGPSSEHLKGSLQTAVVDYLKGHPPSFVKDIALAINNRPEAVRVILSRLLDQHLVRRVGNAWTWPADEARGEEEEI